MPGMDGFINFNGTLEGSIAGGDSGAVKDVKTNTSGSYQSVVDEAGNAMIDLSIYAKKTDVSEDIQSLSNQLDNKQNIINYSTEEQDTGIKWIDGKSIYVKTYNVPTIIIRPEGTNIPSISISEVDTFINGYGISQEYGQVSPLALYDSNGFKCASSIAISVDKIVMYYTKTTDREV